ncbi:MFS transporter [Haladaptatus pallidirubidus]|uniref:Major facilitator superfamily (MFS) profile domain-containing protein n=1 Tax=Haladaptatus pallidirubidus TaxID=1008152 RepID=A0AAV3URH4_9EURY|nr:MFS transporter [Haladaptatus pallidirubidus]
MSWNGRGPSRVILKYYLYQATVTFGLIWPILILFLRNQDLTFSQIALLNTIAMGVTLVGELPAGCLGDYIGHRKSLITSSLLLSGACVGFVRNGTPYACLRANTCEYR